MEEGNRMIVWAAEDAADVEDQIEAARKEDPDLKIEEEEVIEVDFEEAEKEVDSPWTIIGDRLGIKVLEVDVEANGRNNELSNSKEQYRSASVSKEQNSQEQKGSVDAALVAVVQNLQVNPEDQDISFFHSSKDQQGKEPLITGENTNGQGKINVFEKQDHYMTDFSPIELCDDGTGAISSSMRKRQSFEEKGHNGENNETLMLVPVDGNLIKPDDAPDMCEVVPSATNFWVAPPPNFMKINVDGAVAKTRNSGAVGAICRDRQGMFIAASARVFHGISEPATLEALACNEALSLALDCNISQCVIAFDCLEVIKGLEERNLCPYSAILNEIVFRKGLVGEVQFKHENRKSNGEAHCLAKSVFIGSGEICLAPQTTGVSQCTPEHFR
ncbi:hypothetical protein EJB05_21114, partial [Eragrostis curvula]